MGPTQSLAETWSLRRRADRSREPVVTAGVGGVPCARVRRRGLGLWGSWDPPWVTGKNLRAASEQLRWRSAGKALLHPSGSVRSPWLCV